MGVPRAGIWRETVTGGEIRGGTAAHCLSATNVEMEVRMANGRVSLKRTLRLGGEIGNIWSLKSPAISWMQLTEVRASPRAPPERAGEINAERTRMLRDNQCARLARESCLVGSGQRSVVLSSTSLSPIRKRGQIKSTRLLKNGFLFLFFYL